MRLKPPQRFQRLKHPKRLKHSKRLRRPQRQHRLPLRPTANHLHRTRQGPVCLRLLPEL
ncbi:MAG: hypothetical protein QOF74_9249 [Caballeronia mineralivorans]|nr:hypothetical protein [Caballeronia mineralivorans]